ncbi:MAG: DMT family protein [Planctomycetes bacterium]|nr:DMT family protein [Planctomycetota bacterium]
MWTCVVLLLLSNLFMTFAWYGHLRFPRLPLLMVILASWGIALFEYCLQVPANRIGHRSGLSGAELKSIQEVITLAVFVVFAWIWLGETPRWHTLLGFALILGGAVLVFAPWQART